MTVLSDKDIKKHIQEGNIVIKGMDEKQIGPSSVDLRLGEKFRVFKHTDVTHIDPREKTDQDHMELIEKIGKPFIIHPGEFVLGTTKEYVKVPYNLVARLDGRSSLGRLGIIIHSTAGSVHPGFEGNLTLEIANISKIPVALWPGSRICQITFDKLSSECETPYNLRQSSKYSGQTEPVASKINHEND